MTSIQMRAIAVLLRALNRPGAATVASARARLAQQSPQSSPPAALRKRHRVIDRRLGDFTCFSVTPREAATGAAMLYFHGGAYVNGMAPQQWQLVSRIVDAGIRVDVADYGLAPKYTYRDAQPFIAEAYRLLVDEVGAGSITLLGDSAGGAIAVGLAQSLADAGLPQPKQLLLVSPWFDLALASPEVAAIEPRDPWLSAIRLRESGLAWLGGGDPADQLVNPLAGPLHSLPATHVYVGTRDILYPDSMRFERLARAAGSEVTVDVCAGAVHVYPLVPAPEGRRAQHDIVRRLAH